MIPILFHPNGESNIHKLPLGYILEVAYAPQNPPMTESQQGWHVVRFEIAMRKDIRPPYEFHRVYVQLDWRRISEEEAEALWLEVESKDP